MLSPSKTVGRKGGAVVLKRFIGWNRNAAAWLERRFPKVFGAPSYKAELERRIADDVTRLGPSAILEVGGIDRPLLQRGHGFSYIGLDIEERPHCYTIYDRFIVQSIEHPVNVEADMLISITLMEHVPDNEAAARSMFLVLRPGGVMHHYIPSKWHPYSIALRLVGPVLQKWLIPYIRPAAVGVTGYPAFFDHCSPSDMAKVFRREGFEKVDVMPFYRASDYFAFFLPAYLGVALFENLCSVLNWRVFSSGFVISASKPAA
ncbi:methyltransferase domain-containing protein [Mesorhizobium sp.]|uniref:methyltransferase domain-containing protein n=1 Tax=Mesorhizobium sp. TaxID=1871066 RepID=UPI000FE811A6|nr:methyltransferase domain-containing protein [Mesorhizobium sp.]RWK37341.1 MAG: methyltransferase domain-containing protein [Mesorhizobium sp.]RWK66165.1 MAG: methyltransferase domain-containing protein [Mesorhizobium sp.]RWK73248.1 MAG: methyltransferase domain-containing protein [Mesorhizobium sp.]RWK75962.1 MAG: methyltransferase domain-containing protein [Mesorhizobium sp.]RWL00586.1 MAG: methyltransferase domain-containing protein [Mesorhizobium sp.]